MRAAVRDTIGLVLLPSLESEDTGDTAHLEQLLDESKKSNERVL